MHEIFVFYSHIQDSLYNISDSDVIGILNSGDLKKYQSFINYKARSQFLSGRVLLLKALERLNCPALIKEIEILQSGKPSIDGLSFNISHSNDMVGVIITQSNLRVGIDIEMMEESLNFQEIKRSLNSKIINSSVSSEDFIRNWTIVESIIKAKGKSFDELRAIKQIDKETYRFENQVFTINSFNVDNYWISFAVESRDGTSYSIIEEVIKK